MPYKTLKGLIARVIEKMSGEKHQIVEIRIDASNSNSNGSRRKCFDQVRTASQVNAIISTHQPQVDRLDSFVVAAAIQLDSKSLLTVNKLDNHTFLPI